MSTKMSRSNEKDRHKLLKQILASIFFSVTSSLIIMVNKIVLTTYKFPSFQVVGLGQIVAIILVISTAKVLGLVEFPNPSYSEFQKVWPLPLFYVLNLVFGLGSTKKLNVPMYTVLRRFSLLFIAIGQVYVLDRNESMQINISLLFMVGGALIAALNDLAFDLTGYIYVLISDFTTAANVVYSKQKLNSEVTKWELLFYNALISLLPALLIAIVTGDIKNAWQYESWHNPYFLLFFTLSCLMGFFLMLSTVLVTQLTSPLTLSVLGCSKNIFVTYCGMFVGGDYVFEKMNFIGINVSVGAGIAYSYFKFKEQGNKPKQSQDTVQAPSPSTSETPNKTEIV